jgi:hypothetical protein
MRLNVSVSVSVSVKVRVSRQDGPMVTGSHQHFVYARGGGGACKTIPGVAI